MRELDAAILREGMRMGFEVERNTLNAHHEAVEAWRDGRSPMADPPSESPFFIMEVI